MILKEGPGAGYTITVGNYDVKSIDNIVIDSIEIGEYDAIIIKGKCEGKVIANELKASSYMYSTEELNNIPAEFSWFELDCDYEYVSDLIDANGINVLNQRIFDKYKDEYYDSIADVEIDEFTLSEIFDLITIDILDKKYIKTILQDTIESYSTSIVYGGGYVHSTYDGQLSDEEDYDFGDKLICNIYIYPNEFYQWCTPIEYIDKAVTGNNEYDTYDIWDGAYNDIVDSADNLDSAIEIVNNYAEKENADIAEFYITRTTWKEEFDGNVDNIYDEEVWRGDEQF